jgi:signal recognition particle receptor subunit beta
MYSEIVNESGLSQNTLEVIVLGGIGVFVIGLVFYLWWKQIVIGAIGLAAVVVLANHRPKTPVKVEQEQILIEKSVETPVVVTPAKQEDNKEDDSKMFIEDCLHFTDYTKAECEKIWNKRDTVEKELLDVDNVEYKERRAEALKKPNAVVQHYVLR